ncbi:hypothetical protein ACU6D0_004589 [Vibrio alginolyticus]|uniref:hypothetical protein n=1 Tax=Vibrio alginolyticus TaxID=663 RepID=UPI0029288502|nr:hypothetical protein [Vibrio alginolyticus]ELN6939273.1 hypothetical protein [Vibrio alginolyticus]
MGNRVLLTVIVVSTVGVISALIGYDYGLNHPLTVYGVGAFIAIVFFVFGSGENKDKGVPSGVWLALATNVLWLIATFLLLPSLEALEATKDVDKATLISVFLEKLT